MKKLEPLQIKSNFADLFEEVDKKTFKKYIKEYRKKFGEIRSINIDFMFRTDLYDSNLRTYQYDNGTLEEEYECKIAIKYNFSKGKYYLRKDR